MKRFPGRLEIESKADRNEKKGSERPKLGQRERHSALELHFSFVSRDAVGRLNREET